MGIQQLGVIHKVDPPEACRKPSPSRSKQALQWLFWRYATYNGSDVRVAPATLNCIAHVELALGGYGIKGGIRAMIEGLVRLAEHLGVQIHYDSPVSQLITKGKQVCGVQVGTQTHLSDLVVANADAAHVSNDLLPKAQSHLVCPPEPVSMSGWTGIFKAHHTNEINRVAHTVLFPENYELEFRDIFDENKPPEDPTVYLCAQTQCHQRAGWADAEAVFAMINCPLEPINESSPPETWHKVKRQSLNGCAKGLMDEADPYSGHEAQQSLHSNFQARVGPYMGPHPTPKVRHLPDQPTESKSYLACIWPQAQLIQVAECRLQCCRVKPPLKRSSKTAPHNGSG